MIKLKYIYINGFRSPNNSVEVYFSKERASVIYGDNGSGKTTFLRILHALLSQDESTLMAEDVKEIAVTYTYKEKEEYFSVYRSEEEYLEDDDLDDLDDLFSNESKNNYDWTDFELSYLFTSRSISLGVDRGSASPKINISSRELVNLFRRYRSTFRSISEMKELADEVSSYIRHRDSRKKSINLANYDNDHVFLKEMSMENVGETLHTRYRLARRNAARRVQNALFDTLALAIGEQTTSNNQSLEEMIPANFNELIFENKEIIIEALDDSLENSFKDTIVEELRKLSCVNDVSDIKENTLLIKLLLKMSEQLKDSEDELSAVNVIIDKFDSFTSEGKNLEISIDDIAINSPTGRHTISELSSGERHILTLLTLLLDQGRNRNFIIIDEPEISLNTKWQEVLLPTLSEILPNAQLIVASHSPLIAESIDNLVELKAL